MSPEARSDRHLTSMRPGVGQAFAGTSVEPEVRASIEAG